MTGKTKIKKAATHICVAVIWFLVWSLLSFFAKKTGVGLILPSPLQTIEAFVELIKTKRFYVSCGISLCRVLAGWLSGLCVGTVLGCLTAFVKPLNAFFSPVLHIIRATPVASFIVAALVLMSSGKVPVFTGFLISLPVVWANISQGVLSPNKNVLQMARAFNMSKKNKIKFIYLPAVKPYFSAAAITSMGLTWKAGIAAEVICSPKNSIGSGISDAKVYLETPSLFAWTLTVILLSVLLEAVIKLLLRQKEAKK